MNAQRKTRKTPRAGRKTTRGKTTFFSALPGRAAQLVKDGEQATLQLVNTGKHQVEEAAAQVTAGYQELTANVARQGRNARKTVEQRGNAWMSSFKGQADVLLEGVDTVLDRVGLVRKSVHQAELRRLRARLKTPGKATREAAAPKVAAPQLHAV